MDSLRFDNLLEYLAELRKVLYILQFYYSKRTQNQPKGEMYKVRSERVLDVKSSIVLGVMLPYWHITQSIVTREAHPSFGAQSFIGQDPCVDLVSNPFSLPRVWANSTRLNAQPSNHRLVFLAGQPPS